MGFERLCMIVQNVKSNYDTDVFTPIISKIEDISSLKYGKNEKIDIAMRVISDHIRNRIFYCDGQLPSNVKSWLCYKKNIKKICKIFLYLFGY